MTKFYKCHLQLQIALEAADWQVVFGQCSWCAQPVDNPELTYSCFYHHTVEIDGLLVIQFIFHKHAVLTSYLLQTMYSKCINRKFFLVQSNIFLRLSYSGVSSLLGCNKDWGNIKFEQFSNLTYTIDSTYEDARLWLVSICWKTSFIILSMNHKN